MEVFENATPSCPYQALKSYSEMRGHVRGMTSSQDPLFLTPHHDPLSRNTFIRYLKEVLKILGLDSTEFSGHSFRIGAATSAAKVRVEDHLIKTLGRWSSDCYQWYIRTPWEVVKAAQCSMAQYSG